MKKIEKYLMVTVLQSILLIFALLMVLQVFILFVNQMADLGKGHYNLWMALQFVCCRLPYEMFMCFPVICLMGSLIGLSVLANHSELVILRASGLSILNILRIVAVAGIGLICLAMLLAEYSVPKLMFKANNIKLEALNEGHLLREAQSIWFRNQDNFWYIGRVQDPMHLHEVTLFRKNSEGVLSSMEYFQHVTYENNHWQATLVEKTLFHQQHVEKQLLDNENGLEFPLSPGFFRHIEQQPDEMSMTSLWQRIHQLNKQHNVAKEELIFWQRLLQPVNTLLMMLLAIPCVFGPLRSSTMGAKLMTGIALGFGFYILNQMFGFVSQVYQIAPLIGAVTPLIVFTLFGLMLLKRSR
jgi:lipopolysaccharide export system permease protein